LFLLIDIFNGLIINEYPLTFEFLGDSTPVVAIKINRWC
jgi:hypothetical protein